MLDSLRVGWGGDFPESQLQALLSTTVDPNVSVICVYGVQVIGATNEWLHRWDGETTAVG